MGSGQSTGVGDFGGGFGRSYGGGNDISFGSSIDQPRNQMESDHTFEWNRNSFTTNRANDVLSGFGNERDGMTFGGLFKDTRDQLGLGQTFEWRGNRYNTYKGDDALSGIGGEKNGMTFGGALTDPLYQTDFGNTFQWEKNQLQHDDDSPLKFEGGRNKMSFGEAFKDARDQMGPGHTFDWRGKSYTTDRADDPPKISNIGLRGVGEARDDPLRNGAFRNVIRPEVNLNLGSGSQTSSGPLHSNWMKETYSGASRKTARSDQLTISGNEASRKVNSTCSVYYSSIINLNISDGSV